MSQDGIIIEVYIHKSNTLTFDAIDTAFSPEEAMNLLDEIVSNAKKTFQGWIK